MIYYYILRFPFLYTFIAIICVIHLSPNSVTISWSLPSYLSLLSSIIIVMIVFKSSWQHKKWYDFTSFLYNVVILQSLYIFPTWHIERSTQHKARSTKHAWTWMFDISKDLFLVFFFLSFLWNLEISLSNFTAKAHNIFKYN